MDSQICYCLSTLISFLELMKIADAYHVKCRFPRDSISGVIEGLEGIEDFDLFVNRCGYEDIKILLYRKCYVGYVLPVATVRQNYPSLKNLFWYCKGTCFYNKAENVNIQGCNKGRIFYL